MTNGGRVYILNDNFTEPLYMIAIGSIYMSSESNVWKLESMPAAQTQMFKSLLELRKSTSLLVNASRFSS